MRGDPIRTYLAVSGAVFTLLVAAHLWRVTAEGPQVLRQPVFAIATALSLGLATWALLLWRRPLR